MSTVEPESIEAGRRRGRLSWKWMSVLLAASPLVFAGLRIYLYSGGDPVVLQTLVRTLNVQGVLVGSLLPLSSLLFFSAVLAWALYPDFRGRLDRALDGRPLLLATVIAIVIVELLIGSQFLLVVMGLVVVTTIVIRVTRRIRRALGKGESRFWLAFKRLIPDDSFGPAQWVLTPLFVVLILFTSPTGMWLPQEQLTDTKGQVSVAYVIENTEGWMTTIDSNHSIKVFQASTIKARMVCNQGDYWSLMTALLDIHGTVRTHCAP